MLQGRRCKWPTTPLPCQPSRQARVVMASVHIRRRPPPKPDSGGSCGCRRGSPPTWQGYFLCTPTPAQASCLTPRSPQRRRRRPKTHQPACEAARPAPSRPQRTPEARDAPTQRARPELASRSRASRVPPRAFARRIQGREREREGEGPRVARTHQLSSGDPSRCRWDVRRPSAVPFQAQTSTSRLAPPRARGSTRPRSLPQHTQPRSQSTAGMRRAPARRGWPARLRTSPQPLIRTAYREM